MPFGWPVLSFCDWLQELEVENSLLDTFWGGFSDWPITEENGRERSLWKPQPIPSRSSLSSTGHRLTATSWSHLISGRAQFGFDKRDLQAADGV